MKAAIATGLVLAWAGMAAAQPAQTPFGPMAQPRAGAKPGQPIDPALRDSLVKELGAAHLENMEKTTLIRWAETPLPDGGREVVVYISGGGAAQFGEMGGWCGSGGCGIEIFEAHDGHYRKIGDVQAWLPVRVLPQSHEGHPDLSVWVQGGGVQPGYPSRIIFQDGHDPVDGDPLDGHKVPAGAGRLLLDEDQAGAKLFP